ncbi:hypothetical protein D3C71_1118040 [compost metagenome]
MVGDSGAPPLTATRTRPPNWASSGFATRACSTGQGRAAIQPAAWLLASGVGVGKPWAAQNRAQPLFCAASYSCIFQGVGDNFSSSLAWMRS